MPPKRSTRSSTRAASSKNDDDDNKKTDEPKQQTLHDTKNGVIDVETGEKRDKPDDDDNVIDLTSADDKKDGAPANKRQKQEAAEKGTIEGGAKGIDEESEKAKATGREIMENANIETAKPSRGTLEKGTVYFWYKPKVEVEDPEGLDDVSKCHMLLLPHSSSSESEGRPTYRLLTFGRKHLPESRDAGAHEVEWGRISGVGKDIKDLKDTLGASTYETKTRGTRHQPASRCAAQGYYILRSPESNEDDGVKPIEKADENLPRDFPVYFAYSIAVPEEKDFGDVQKELRIESKGSFAIQVKNPDAPATNPRAAGSTSGAKEYPPELRGLFTTRFIPANPVKLLDYTGHELLFISGRHKNDVKEVIEQVEKPAEEESKDLEKKEKEEEDEEEAIFEEVFKELDLFRASDEVPGLKALEGEWA